MVISHPHFPIWWQTTTCRNTHTFNSLLHREAQTKITENSKSMNTRWNHEYNAIKKTREYTLNTGNTNLDESSPPLTGNYNYLDVYNISSQQRTKGLQPENGHKNWFGHKRPANVHMRVFSLAIKITFHFNSRAHAEAQAEIRNKKQT